jgi:acyl-coenzyme A synthetase/AMP-(fatty) acid ligase
MGAKKFVKLSKENIKENTKSIIRYLKINSNDRTITNMSFAYSYMLSVINTHIEKGGSIYLTQNSILNKEFWKEYYNNKITSFNGVPYIYKIILKLGLDKIYTSYLKTMTQAGGKLDDISTKKIIEFCKKKRVKFITMYGQTEASPRISYLSWTNALKKIGSIGKSIHGGKMWIQKKGKKITEPGVIGDLIYEGKNVSLGYSKNYKDLLRGDDNKGVLNTEDLACFDLEGFFYIKGRKKRIVKLFGNRFDLNEIEERINKNGQEIVCTGTNDELNVYYTNTNSKKKILSQIIKITKQNKDVFKMRLLTKFPRTASGKINYNILNRNA